MPTKLLKSPHKNPSLALPATERVKDTCDFHPFRFERPSIASDWSGQQPSIAGDWPSCLAAWSGQQRRGWVSLFLLKPFSFCALLLCLAAPGWADPADTFTVTGAVVRPGAWGSHRVDTQLPHAWQMVPYTLKGARHTAHAVPLLTLLNAVGLRVDPHAKNARLRMTVLVTGRDGYTAAFSLAELLPDFGARRVWVAFQEDGKALPPTDAPAALLVPQDGKAGRWVHGVASVTVMDAH